LPTAAPTTWLLVNRTRHGLIGAHEVPGSKEDI
jgi:hypothetical protein